MSVDLTILEDHFDREFYLRSYRDVAEAQIDPLEHFCGSGWREGRNPSTQFDTQFYLSRNPDVAASGVNPLYHYVVAGQREGRRCVAPLKSERLRIQHNFWSVGYQKTHYTPVESDEQCLTVSALTAHLETILRDGPTIISISHDDYRENIGGVQKLIASEEESSSDLGWNYLHLSPSEHRLGISDQEQQLPVGLRLNGSRLGSAAPSVLLQALTCVRGDNPNPVYGVVHHLMGHHPEQIGGLLTSLSCAQTLVWCHDFFTLCRGIQLLRNGVTFCHAPETTSMSCSICSHGEGRGTFMRRMRDFFTCLSPIVVAPSEAALDIWARHNDYPRKKAIANPLARLVLAESIVPFGAGTREHPLRVAFLGHRSLEKGWPTFQGLVDRLKHDERYAFYHFGLQTIPVSSSNITHVPIDITQSGENAMIDTVAAYGIDAVIIWSNWPETFCYAAYEAIAGGAIVIAPRHSGNVETLLTVAAPSQGLLMSSEEELIDLLETTRLQDMLAERSRRRGCLIPERNSVGLLQDEVVLSQKSMTLAAHV